MTAGVGIWQNGLNSLSDAARFAGGIINTKRESVNMLQKGFIDEPLWKDQLHEGAGVTRKNPQVLKPDVQLARRAVELNEVALSLAVVARHCTNTTVERRLMRKATDHNTRALTNAVRSAR